MTQEFEREQRYVVLKVKDVMQRLSEKDILTLARILDEIDAYRKSIGKKSLECVVIESDWPEYEPTWKAIEARVPGAQPAAVMPDKVEVREDKEGEIFSRGSYNEGYDNGWNDCIDAMVVVAPEAKP